MPTPQVLAVPLKRSALTPEETSAENAKEKSFFTKVVAKGTEDPSQDDIKDEKKTLTADNSPDSETDSEFEGFKPEHLLKCTIVSHNITTHPLHVFFLIESLQCL